MSELIKKEQLTGSRKVVVGEKNNDLVLRTLGKVYIQTGSKFTLLTDLIKSVDKASTSSSINNLITIKNVEELNSLPYPGDNKFVFVSSNSNLYISVLGTLIPIVAKNEAEVNWESLKETFVQKTGDRMSGELYSPKLSADQIESSGQVTINTSKAPLVINSKEFVKNLNVQYLGGKERDEFAIKNNDEQITGSWLFKAQTYFDNLTAFKRSLVSATGFAPGFSGYGWMLDHETNTLTVDNLVVRKAMHVYELIVNKIKATNGSLWVSDSAEIDSVEKLTPDYYWFYKYVNDQLVQINDVGLTPSQINDINWGEVDYWDAWISDGAALCSGYEDFEVVGTDDEGNDIIELLNKPYITDSNPDDHDVLKIENGIPVYDEDSKKQKIRNLYHHYFNGQFYKIVLDEDNKEHCPFRVNDIVRCQRFIDNSIKYYDAVVTYIKYSEYLIVRLADLVTGNYTRLEVDPETGKLVSVELEHGIDDDNDLRELSVPTEKDGLVRVGNIGDKKRQGAIYMTSNEDQGPSLNIMSDMCRPDYSVLIPELINNKTVYRTPLKVKLGSLDGIYDPAFGYEQPEGYGLYAENVFIKGKFVQVDPDGTEIPLTLYRGTYSDLVTYYNRNQVTYEGSLYTCIGNNIKGINPTNKDKWELAVEAGQQGADGVPGITVNIKGDMVFTYEDNFEKLVGSEILELVSEVKNLVPNKVSWYLKNTSGKWVKVNTSILTFRVYESEELMQYHYGPIAETFWNDNKVVIKSEINDEFYDIAEVIKLSSGASAYDLIITSTKGSVFKNGVLNTMLIAYAYHKGDLIPDEVLFQEYKYSWSKYDANGNPDEEWNNQYSSQNIKSVSITHKDVYRKSIFNCILLKI